MLSLFAAEAGADVFRVSGNSPAGSPWEAQWLRFAAELEARDDVDLSPELHVRGQLGSPDATIRALRRGRIHLGGFPLSSAAALVPELAVLNAPFAFADHAELDYVLEHHLARPLGELFERQGVVVVDWSEAGWNHVYGKRPLKRPASVAGYRMRAQPTPASRLLLERLDADVIPLPYSEVLSGLQTGLVDGGESTLALYLAGGMAEEAPHVVMTAHSFDAGVILANARWWRGLSERERQAVRAALGPRERLRAEVAALESELMGDAAGEVAFHRPTPADLEAWRAATADVGRELAGSLGPEAEKLYQALLAGQRAYRRNRG
jgi:TRAP-type C4-dicarboxylate transport system substrate-binding protein